MSWKRRNKTEFPSVGKMFWDLSRRTEKHWITFEWLRRQQAYCRTLPLSRTLGQNDINNASQKSQTHDNAKTRSPSSPFIQPRKLPQKKGGRNWFTQKREKEREGVSVLGPRMHANNNIPHTIFVLAGGCIGCN